jgi:hypothetical protein
MRVSFASARRWSLITRISPVSGAFFGESFGLRFAYGALGGSPTRFCSTPDFREDVWINAVNECHYKRLNDDVISLTIFGGAAEETDLRVRQKAW